MQLLAKFKKILYMGFRATLNFRTLYTVLLKKKTLTELLTNKTYQEKLGFLALFRIEQGFPF